MDTPEPPKSFSEKFKERLAASRFFTFSLLLHIVIVVVGGSVVLIKKAMDPPDFEAAEGLIGGEDASVAPPSPVDLSQQVFTPTAPELSAPQLTTITTTNISTPVFQVAAVTPQIKPVVSSDSMNKALTDAAKNMGKGLGAAGLPGSMAGRMGGSARRAAMMAKGGKDKSEQAVLKGLRWLVKNQNNDGSWSGEYRAAMTGLALLAFLGHGELPTSPEFGATVEKAVNWILTNGQKNEGRLNMQSKFSQPGVYEHGIVTYALGEYYTMSKDERAVDILKQAIKYIIDGQGPDGGWMYSFDKTQSDTSVSGWQIQALKAAHLSGLEFPGLTECMDKAMLNLKRVRGKQGGFGYRTPQDRYSLSGVGVLCTYFWKQKKDEMVTDGMKFIIDKVKSDEPIKYNGPTADLYAWYYNTQAALMVGGSAWTTWNRLFQDEIVDAQSPDGSWPPHGGKGHGPEKKPEGAGPVYRTTLCILMLEVYYRYMPSTKS
jgi:hypothetical protein